MIIAPERLVPGISENDWAMPSLSASSALRCDQTGDSASLAVLSGAEILYVAHVSTNRRIRLGANVGTRFPVHATSLGKVLLAFMQHYITPGRVIRVLGPDGKPEGVQMTQDAQSAKFDVTVDEGQRRDPRELRAGLGLEGHAARPGLDELDRGHNREP